MCCNQFNIITALVHEVIRKILGHCLTSSSNSVNNRVFSLLRAVDSEKTEHIELIATSN